MRADVPATRNGAGVQPLYRQVLVSRNLGGGEKVALSLNAALNARAAGSSQLLVPEGGETERHVVGLGLSYQRYRLEALTSRRRLRSLVANLDLWRKVRRPSSSLLHVHSPFVYGAMRPLLAATGLRCVLHLHLDYGAEELAWALRRPPDLMILCAGFMTERVLPLLRSGDGRRTRIAVVRNAVDTQRFFPVDRAAAKQKLEVPPGRPVLLMLANLAEHKGQMTAIRAVARLRDQGLDPLLWLVGEEREGQGFTETLDDFVSGASLQRNVIRLGYRSDIPTLLGAADALLLPSVREGLPLSILEAQAMKVPVLAAPTAGIPEVVEHGRTGYLLDAHDDAAYARTLQRLLASPDEGREISEAAYERVISTADMSRYTENILAAYQQLEEGGA